MKMNKLFAAAFIASAMALASCAKEDNSATAVKAEGDQCVITLNIKGNDGTKAAVLDPNDEDAVINDMVVIADEGATGVINASQYFVAPSTSVQLTTGTTAAKNVTVICNVGATLAGQMTAATNLSTIKALTRRIDDNTSAKAVVAKNVWLWGQGALTQTAAGTATTKAQMAGTVQLGYIPSKFYVQVTNNMTMEKGGVSTPLSSATDNASAKTLVQGVMLMNAGTWSTFMKDAAGTFMPLRANVTVPFFYNGMATWSGLPSAYVDKPGLTGDYTANTGLYNRAFSAVAAKYGNNGMLGGQTITMNTATNVVPDINACFYSFPPIASGATNPKTYVVVYGKFNPTGRASALAAGQGDWFWTVSVETLLAKSFVTPAVFTNGQKYVVTLTLSGDAGNGDDARTDGTGPNNNGGGDGGGGTEDPTKEIANADFTVNITNPLWVVPTLQPYDFK